MACHFRVPAAPGGFRWRWSAVSAPTPRARIHPALGVGRPGRATCPTRGPGRSRPVTCAKTCWPGGRLTSSTSKVVAGETVCAPTGLTDRHWQPRLRRWPQRFGGRTFAAPGELQEAGPARSVGGKAHERVVLYGQWRRSGPTPQCVECGGAVRRAGYSPARTGRYARRDDHGQWPGRIRPAGLADEFASSPSPAAEWPERAAHSRSPPTGRGARGCIDDEPVSLASRRGSTPRNTLRMPRREPSGSPEPTPQEHQLAGSTWPTVRASWDREPMPSLR